MEMMFILLVVIAAAVIVLGKNRKRTDVAETAPVAQIPMPEKQNTIDQELMKRVEEFMNYDRFSLVIQPMVDFTSNTVVGGEVLSRLHHPERGVIFPNNFLHCIDAAGLYPKFDRYVFRKACAWLSRSLEAGETVEYISCNFSRKTLSEASIASQLTEIADHYSIPYEKLAIEITEREKESDTQQFLLNLKQLNASGFRIFLDDYGIGDTSLKDMIDYPLDTVKIDRSMLYETDTDQGKSVYRTLVNVAREMGLKVICTGIETEEQSCFAREVGCDYGQGFLYFHPMDVDEMFETMEKSRISEEE